MSILTRPIEELLSYLLTRLHGGFLLQQLDHRNFQVNVAEGIYTLKDLQINPSAINQNLSESLLHLFSASVSRVTLQVPNVFRFLDEDPINVTIHHLILDLCSANESGCSVIRDEKPGPCTEEDGAGINVLTKKIGNFLSKINLQANLVKIKIRVKPSDKQYVQIVIPKMSFTEKKSDKETCNKTMKIEGLRVNLMNSEEDVYDPHDFSNLLLMEQDIEVELNLSKELLFINCVVSKICALLSLNQVKSLIQIFSGLKKSGSFEQTKISALTQALKAIGEDIQDSFKNVLTIRENVVKVHVSCVVVCVTLEETPPFNKKWVYNEGPYSAVPTSHIVLLAKKIRANHSEKNTSIKFSRITANHYNYLPAAALDASELFASAKQSFFNEFFVNNPQGGFWEPDFNKCHFCTGNILLFRRSHTDFLFLQPAHFRSVEDDLELDFQNNSLTITSAAIEIHLNVPLLIFLKSLMESNKNPPSKINTQFKVSVPLLRINYQEMLDKCLCHRQEWLLVCDTTWISVNNSETFEITLSKFEATILVDDIITSILLASNLKCIRKVKEAVNNELLEERNEEVIKSYYEPNQGTIGIKPGSETEPFNVKVEGKTGKFKEVSQVEEELAMGKACCVNQIEINKVTIRVEPEIIEKLLKIVQGREDKELWPIASVIKIGVISLELLEKDTTGSRHISQSTFSYYSLDASVNRTMNVMTEAWIGLIIGTFKDVQILSLNNCIKSMQKYAKIKALNIEVYAKHQELLYCLGENPIEVVLTNSDSEEIFVKLENLVLSINTVLAYSQFLAGFNLNNPKTRPSLDSKRIVLNNIFLDFCNNDLRVLSLVDTGSVQIVSVDSNSNSFFCNFKSFRVYNQEGVVKPHPVVNSVMKDYEDFLIQSGCTLICTLDSLELYATLITPLHPPASTQDPKKDLPAYSCMLGSSSCQRISGPFFISKEIRSSILHQKLLDLHINLGCIIFHLYPSTATFFSTFLIFPTPSEDTPDTFMEDSGKSSDESEKSSKNNPGILIKPSEPGKIANINLQDYLEPEKSPLGPVKKPQVLGSVHNLTKLSVIHCHADAPATFLKTKNEKFLHNLNAEHGLPTLRFTGGVSLIILNIYSKPTLSRSIRKLSMSQITVKCQSLSISFSKFPQKLHYSWRLTLSIYNLTVKDFISKSIVRFILNRDSQKPINGPFLTLEVAAVWPRPDFISETELIVSISVIPIKLNIDQHFVDFILDVINWKPEEQVIMQQTGILPNQGLNAEKKQTQKEAYVQKMVIEGLSINIDYIPHSLDARYPGGNILNLFEIRDFTLTLPKVDLKGVKNLSSSIDLAWNWWLEHIKDKELYRLIGNIGPFSSIKNIKSAFLEILYIGSTGSSVTDSTKRALVGLVKSASVEGINFIETLVTGTYSVFMGVGAVVGVNLPSRQKIVRPLQDAQLLIDRDRINIQHGKYRD